MRFGGPLPWTGHLATRENLLLVAQTVERLGYEWVTAGEHLFYPKEMRTPHPRAGKLPVEAAADSHEIYTLFTWLAAQTTTLRFMSAMQIIPYRSPFVTAKLIAGLDFFSGGRFTLGAAVGWMKDEFDVLNMKFEDRGRITDEYLAIIKTLLTGDGPFKGEYFSFPEIWFEPKTIQRPLPVIIGGTAIGPIFRRVAKYGAGWWPYPLSVEAIAAAMSKMRDVWDEAGRSNEKLEVHTYGRVVVNPKGGVGITKDEMLEQIAANAGAGITHMSMMFSELGGGGAEPVPIEAVLDATEWFATEVMPVTKNI